MSDVMDEGTGGSTPSSVRHGTASCELLVVPQEGLPTHQSGTGTLALVQWVGVTTLVAVRGFALLCIC